MMGWMRPDSKGLFITMREVHGCRRFWRRILARVAQYCSQREAPEGQGSSLGGSEGGAGPEEGGAMAPDDVGEVVGELVRPNLKLIKFLGVLL